MTAQLLLPSFTEPDPPPERLSIEERCEAWLEVNPWVLDQLERLADELVEAGVSRFGVKALVERLRWDWTVARATTGEPWRLNNSFTSRLARRLIERRPDLASFIETRKLRAR